MIVSDQFERTVSSGFGTADVGGPWSVSSTARTKVTGGQGVIYGFTGANQDVQAWNPTTATNMEVSGLIQLNASNPRAATTRPASSPAHRRIPATAMWPVCAHDCRGGHLGPRACRERRRYGHSDARAGNAPLLGGGRLALVDPPAHKRHDHPGALLARRHGRAGGLDRDGERQLLGERPGSGRGVRRKWHVGPISSGSVRRLRRHLRVVKGTVRTAAEAELLDTLRRHVPPVDVRDEIRRADFAASARTRSASFKPTEGQVQDMSRAPNLFVVGVARAGTTSLSHYLDQHPEIFMSPVKEPYFFSSYHPDWVPVSQTLFSYMSLFAGATIERYLGEASPAYFWDEDSPAAIKEASKDARIIISLRDPIKRAYSEYLLLRRSLEDWRPTFAEAVREEMALDPSERGTNPQYNYVDRGYYAARVERYFELFGTERVHVLFFEDFVKSTREEMERVFEFLQVDPEPARSIAIAPQNQGGAPKNRLAAVLLYSKQLRRVGRLVVPPRGRPRVERSLMQRGRMDVDDQTRQGLYELYADDWMRLKELLGKSPPWADGVSADGSA